MVQGIVVNKLPDPVWGFPTIARVLPRDGNPWGLLAFLEGTPWDPLFPRVPEGVLEWALRGHATPLINLLGPPPKALVKRLPVAATRCRNRDCCINAGPKCVPGPDVPPCWETPDVEPPQSFLVNHVVQLWKDGIVVVLPIPTATNV